MRGRCSASSEMTNEAIYYCLSFQRSAFGELPYMKLSASLKSVKRVMFPAFSASGDFSQSARSTFMRGRCSASSEMTNAEGALLRNFSLCCLLLLVIIRIALHGTQRFFEICETFDVAGIFIFDISADLVLNFLITIL